MNQIMKVPLREQHTYRASEEKADHCFLRWWCCHERGKCRPYLRTIQSWEAGDREPPEYVQILVLEKLEQLKEDK